MKYDVLIIGAGHAGLEAAFASYRLGCKTAIVTMTTDNMGMPSCNPSIGGSAKGHLVKEIDAFDGLMPLMADRAGISFKMLNRSKGPAIWSPRCQIDKDLYPAYVKRFMLQNTGIDFISARVDEVLVNNHKVTGVQVAEGNKIEAKAVILSAGTFLKGVMHTGTNQTKGGRIGEDSSDKISDLLNEYGFERGRLKTGTPPRIHADSIDYSKCDPESGEENFTPFSYRTKKVKNSILCWHTNTNPDTHSILSEGFDQSPMFSGRIKGAGPRYCPSIEDKIDRFAQRDSHKILLEPEGTNTKSVYVNGFSTSLPLDIQIKGMKTIPGLKNAEMLKQGYAVEYDFFYPYQLNFTMETKAIAGLYFAGQINGTSGYEEAGVQGMVAGINAANKILGREEFELKRNEAYTGVLIDDLVNKSTEEPYRIFTSLAEYRLLLRQDNADVRLADKARDHRLISNERYDQILKKRSMIKEGIEYYHSYKPDLNQVNVLLSKYDQSTRDQSSTLAQLLKRNLEMDHSILEYFPNDNSTFSNLSENPLLNEIVENEVKYEGYIKRMEKEIAYFMENETKRLPSNLDYSSMNSLSREAIEKLEKIRPHSLGQASRISGISATDISVISLYLKK
ncbi:MAG: tRNA uridine-5-carboxymethylaminomethyl(34) synthesis enzyme MnmG [Candidatus Kapaibacteriales bacterium]